MEFFHKGGGGSEAIQKFWDTFCAPTILEFWAEKGGGLTKSRIFWVLITLVWVKYDQKKCPKSSKKKLAYKKVSQKFQKSGGCLAPYTYFAEASWKGPPACPESACTSCLSSWTPAQHSVTAGSYSKCMWQATRDSIYGIQQCLVLVGWAGLYSLE